MSASFILVSLLMFMCIMDIDSMDVRKSDFTFKLRLLSERCNIKAQGPDEGITNVNTSLTIEGITVMIAVQKVDSLNPYDEIRQVASLRDSDFDLVIYNAKSNHSSQFYRILENSSVRYIIADRITIKENQTLLDWHVDTCPTLPLGDKECIQNSNATSVYQGGSSFLTNVILPILSHLNWMETLIIYEEEFDLEIDNILSKLSAMNILSLILRLGKSWTDHSSKVIKEHMEIIVKNGGNVTLLCRHYCSKIINEDFKAIKQNPYLHASIHISSWIVIHINDIEPVVETRNVLFDNVAIVSLPQSVLWNKINYHVSLEHTLYEAIVQAEESDGLDHSHVTNNVTWKHRIIKNIQNIIDRSSFPCTRYQINTLMWVNDSKRALNSIGTIRLSGELYKHSIFFPNTDFGFNGRRLLVASLEWDPLVTRVNGSVTNGICMDILRQMSRNLNFTYEIIRPPDGEWGKRLPNGSFTGMVGQLQRHEVDLVAAPLSVTSSREFVLDFIYPFYNEDTRILHRKPTKSESNWRKFIGPFHPYIFLCLGVALLLGSFLMAAFEGAFPQYRNTPNRHEDDGLHRVDNASWYLLGALLLQGGVHRAESITGRMFLSNWWIFSITMMGIYCGSLIAFLTVSKEIKGFRTMRDLIDLDDYKWGFMDGTAWMDLFKDTTVQERAEFWNKLKYFNQTDPSVLSKQASVHISKVLKGKYAFLADNMFLQQIMRDHCELAISDEVIFPIQYSFALPNNSLFVKAFSKYMINIHESGLIEHWENKVLKGQRHCDFQIFTGMEPIAIYDVQSAILVVCAGLFLSLSAFLIECCVRMYQTRRTKKKLHLPQETK